MNDHLGPWRINKVHNADALSALPSIPDDSVDLAITSPPYWGQRGDLGIGTEADPRDYLSNLTSVLTEVMRCLRPSGLLWLNMGDAYNTPINWRLEDHQYSTLGADKAGLACHNSAYTKNRGRRRAFIRREVPWAQYGNLLGLPYRIVLALCDRGMFFRGEVIWAKNKAMPEGRCRRPHRKHESIYIIAKREDHSFQTVPPVGSVWQLEPDLNLTPHTSTFPVSLPLTCIRASGVSTGIVLDPFMGSGTTGIAAKQLGWSYTGFDVNDDNVRTANDRIEGKLASLSLPSANQEPPLVREKQAQAALISSGSLSLDGSKVET